MSADTNHRSSFTYVPHEGRVELDTADPAKIDIRDIAFVLSRKRRFNSVSNVTVGIHSLCAQERSARLGHSPALQLIHLLHDGSEAYLSDLTRPLKRRLPWFQQLEEQWERAIFERFGLPPELCAAENYREIDNWLLATEIAHQFRDNLDQWTVTPVKDEAQFYAYDFWLSQSEATVEQVFVQRYQELLAEIVA